MMDNRFYRTAEDAAGNRRAVESAIGAVLFNVSNFPASAQVHLLGQDMAPLREKLLNAVVYALDGRVE